MTTQTTPGLSETPWSPRSWRDLPADQQPPWDDPAALDEAMAELSRWPPLVFAGEARDLTAALGDVCAGRGFLLHAGDCAESFDGVGADAIRDKLKVILQMAVVLTYGAGVKTVKVGRIAGQYAKPRSSPAESATASNCRASVVTWSTTSRSRPRLAAPTPVASSSRTTTRQPP